MRRVKLSGTLNDIPKTEDESDVRQKAKVLHGPFHKVELRVGRNCEISTFT